MSPASACCLRNCRRRPARSTSAATWRPFSVCRGRLQRRLFSQRLGKLRPADANALTRLDLDLQPRDRPVAPVGYRLFEQGRDDTQGRFTLHRGRTGRHVGLQPLHAAAHEGAAPQANRVLAHAERLGDPGTRPAGQRQQHSARSVRLAAITRFREAPGAPPLFAPRSPPTKTCPPCSAPRRSSLFAMRQITASICWRAR